MSFHLGRDDIGVHPEAYAEGTSVATDVPKDRRLSASFALLHDETKLPETLTFGYSKDHMSDIRRNPEAGKGKPRFAFEIEAKDAVEENAAIDAFDVENEEAEKLSDLEKEEIGALSEDELVEFGRPYEPEEKEQFGDPTKRKMK